MHNIQCALGLSEMNFEKIFECVLNDFFYSLKNTLHLKISDKIMFSFKNWTHNNLQTLVKIQLVINYKLLCFYYQR